MSPSGRPVLLFARQEAHEAGLPYITDGELSARLTASKATPERAWLADVSAVILQQSLADLNNARFKVLASGKLRLPRIGDVPVRWSRDLPSQPSSVTVIRDSAGRYFASFVIQTGQIGRASCRERVSPYV